MDVSWGSWQWWQRVCEQVQAGTEKDWAPGRPYRDYESRREPLLPTTSVSEPEQVQMPPSACRRTERPLWLGGQPGERGRPQRQARSVGLRGLRLSRCAACCSFPAARRPLFVLLRERSRGGSEALGRARWGPRLSWSQLASILLFCLYLPRDNTPIVWKEEGQGQRSKTQEQPVLSAWAWAAVE